MAYYDYKEHVLEDVRQHIEENYDREEITNALCDKEARQDLAEKISCSAWISDYVTGNASGSYTFCRHTAREYVIDNLDLLWEAAGEFDVANEEIGERFLDEDWEYFDVTIRCYLLEACIAEALDTYDESEAA